MQTEAPTVEESFMLTDSALFSQYIGFLDLNSENLFFPVQGKVHTQITKNLADLIHHDSPISSNEIMQKVADTTLKSVSFEVLVVNNDRTEFPFNANLYIERITDTSLSLIKLSSIKSINQNKLAFDLIEELPIGIILISKKNQHPIYLNLFAKNFLNENKKILSELNNLCRPAKNIKTSNLLLDQNEFQTITITDDKAAQKDYLINKKRIFLECYGDVDLLSIYSDNDLQSKSQPNDLFSKAFQHEKLFQASRVLSVSEMASMLAHELNQPLSTVANYLTGLLKNTQGKSTISVEDLQMPLEAAKKQATHASNIIQRMREFVRSKEPVITDVRVQELFDSVLEIANLEAERYQVKMSVEIANDVHTVKADAVLIEQVLLNLVRNAIHATSITKKNDRLVEITAKKENANAVRIAVSDNGIGLSNEVQQKVFSPFFTTKSDGLGLGLSICRSILEIHRGTLGLVSSKTGGAFFYFTLPTT